MQNPSLLLYSKSAPIKVRIRANNLKSINNIFLIGLLGGVLAFLRQTGESKIELCDGSDKLIILELLKDSLGESASLSQMVTILHQIVDILKVSVLLLPTIYLLLLIKKQITTVEFNFVVDFLAEQYIVPIFSHYSSLDTDNSRTILG